MNEHEKLTRAKQRVEAITGFYIHLAVFVLVMTILFVVNLTVGEFWWVQWPLLGWGTGLLAHAALIFGKGPSFIRNWQIRKIHELKDKM